MAWKGKLTWEMKPKIQCTHLLCLPARSLEHFQSGYTPRFGDVLPYTSFSHSGTINNQIFIYYNFVIGDFHLFFWTAWTVTCLHLMTVLFHRGKGVKSWDSCSCRAVERKWRSRNGTDTEARSRNQWKIQSRTTGGEWLLKIWTYLQQSVGIVAQHQIV